MTTLGERYTEEETDEIIKKVNIDGSGFIKTFMFIYY
jgi:Ca2+-binding EF-hand superfamily protein